MCRVHFCGAGGGRGPEGDDGTPGPVGAPLLPPLTMSAAAAEEPLRLPGPGVSASPSNRRPASREPGSLGRAPSNASRP